MAGRRKLVAGNWKMNGLRADGTALADAVAAHAASGLPAAVELLVCPPATLIWPVRDRLSGAPVALGGQDCSAAAGGAHTGDVSAAMLRDAGCSHVILGHSERRQNHGETDAAVRAKVEAAHRAGLVAIVCVGETEAERDRGEAEAVVARQLQGSLPDGIGPADTVIAYEPVWAIGTGRTATVEDVAQMHAAIRARLAARFAAGADIRVLYGGSVKPANAASLMALADVDGALVGGASLSADDFWAIARSCH